MTISGSDRRRNDARSSAGSWRRRWPERFEGAAGEFGGDPGLELLASFHGSLRFVRVKSRSLSNHAVGSPAGSSSGMKPRTQLRLSIALFALWGRCRCGGSSSLRGASPVLLKPPVCRSPPDAAAPQAAKPSSSMPARPGPSRRGQGRACRPGRRGVPAAAPASRKPATPASTTHHRRQGLRSPGRGFQAEGSAADSRQHPRRGRQAALLRA